MSDDPRALAARLMQSSRFALSIDELGAHIAERRARLLARPTAPEPTFDPAPMPTVETPELFAQHFWASRALPDLGKPTGTSTKNLGLRLVPGGKDVDSAT